MVDPNPARDKESVLGIGQIIMDAIDVRLECNRDDRDCDYWWSYINNMSKVPLHTIMRDADRWQMCLFGAEYLRSQCGDDWRQIADSELRQTPSRHDPTQPQFDPYEENVAQDGRHWGLKMERPNLPKQNIAPEERQAERETDPKPAAPTPTLQLLEETKLSNIPRTQVPEEYKALPREETPHTEDDEETMVVPDIKEQVDAQKKAELEKFLGSQTPIKELEAIRATAPDTYVQKWAIAERLASKPKEAWQAAPYEIVKMIEYIIGWRASNKGSVPSYPDNLIEIWWNRPYLDMTPDALARRDRIVGQVRDFWNKSVAQSKDQMNLRSESYRVTLAAMALEKAIEEFAQGADNAMQVKECAIAYFHAHFPIETLGVKPGPITTLDPDFNGYVKLLQKYNIPFGKLLHEANL